MNNQVKSKSATSERGDKQSKSIEPMRKGIKTTRSMNLLLNLRRRASELEVVNG